MKAFFTIIGLTAGNFIYQFITGEPNYGEAAMASFFNTIGVIAYTTNPFHA